MRNGYKIAVSDVEDYKIKALKGDVLSQKALADFYCCYSVFCSYCFNAGP